MPSPHSAGQVRQEGRPSSEARQKLTERNEKLKKMLTEDQMKKL
jgi:hypothetical protein